MARDDDIRRERRGLRQLVTDDDERDGQKNEQAGGNQQRFGQIVRVFGGHAEAPRTEPVADASCEPEWEFPSIVPGV